MSENAGISNVDDPKKLIGIDKLNDLGLSKTIISDELTGMSGLINSNLANAVDPSELIGLDKKFLDSLSIPSEILAELMKNSIVPVNEFFIPDITFDIPAFKSLAELSFNEQQNYYDQSLRLLEQIKNNTATLSTILELITFNNDKQEEILQLIYQMVEIAAAKNQEDLNHKFEKVLENIKNALELGEITGKLLYAAYTIFAIVSPIIGK